jgi:hypothetical protein
MKQYEGLRTLNRTSVTVNKNPLSPRFDLLVHAQGGFDWGCGSVGAAQLALAILADHLQDDQRAITLHQRFKWRLVATLPRGSWALTTADVASILKELR